MLKFLKILLLIFILILHLQLISLKINSFHREQFP